MPEIPAGPAQPRKRQDRRGRVADRVPGFRASGVSNATGSLRGGSAPMTHSIATEFTQVAAILDGPVSEIDRREPRRLTRGQALSLLTLGSLLTLLGVGL